MHRRKFDKCEHEDWYVNDDDEMGVCPDCGARCTWHYEKDEFDNYPDYSGESYQKVADEWYPLEELEWNDDNGRYEPINA